jgi:hypothetical protein
MRSAGWQKRRGTDDRQDNACERNTAGLREQDLSATTLTCCRAGGFVADWSGRQLVGVGSISGGDGGYVVGGDLVAQVVDERDAHGSLGAPCLADHGGALGARQVLVTPLLQHADQDV